MSANLKLNEMQAELAAVLTLNAIYFGPETKSAVSSLDKALGTTKPWWTVDTGLLRTLVVAMGKEIFRDQDRGRT
jgi:hypothetical protein